MMQRNAAVRRGPFRSNQQFEEQKIERKVEGDGKAADAHSLAHNEKVSARKRYFVPGLHAIAVYGQLDEG